MKVLPHRQAQFDALINGLVEKGMFAHQDNATQAQLKQVLALVWNDGVDSVLKDATYKILGESLKPLYFCCTVTRLLMESSATIDKGIDISIVLDAQQRVRVLLQNMSQEGVTHVESVDNHIISMFNESAQDADICETRYHNGASGPEVSCQSGPAPCDHNPGVEIPNDSVERQGEDLLLRPRATNSGHSNAPLQNKKRKHLRPKAKRKLRSKSSSVSSKKVRRKLRKGPKRL